MPVSDLDSLPRHIHLVGAGGAHMSAIAQILLDRGHIVSGSDMRASGATAELARRGARISIGHDSRHLGEAGLVVATAAAKPDNPEIVAARERGIPVVSRAEMVARIMRGRRGIAVAGTHGKTTTSAMVAYVLAVAGRDPTFLIGGDIPDLGGNCRSGAGEEIVVEADEYARAFLQYEPQVAVITNIEADHLEYYGSLSAITDAFAGFMGRVAPDGLIIACLDSPLLAEIIDGARSGQTPAGTDRIQAYSLNTAADWQASQIAVDSTGRQSFAVSFQGREYHRFAVRLPGRHNVSNALAVIAAAHELQVPVEATERALRAFRGARRRFEVIGQAGGVDVVDDFAHHPTEIKATLAAARQRFPGRRLVVVFQPHTYSRSRYLLDEFRTAFADAGLLFVLETYAARETPDQGMSAQALAAAISSPPARYAGDLLDAPSRILDAVREGDVILTIGAGDISELGPMLLEQIQ